MDIFTSSVQITSVRFSGEAWRTLRWPLYFFALLMLFASPAHAFDLVNPYFHKEGCGEKREELPAKPSDKPYGPEPPHPIAKGCGLSEAACIDEYDYRVLSLALMAHDVSMCRQSTTPDSCRTNYVFTADDGAESPPIRECTWVSDISQHVATLFMPLSRQSRRVVARPGWTVHEYMGDCSALSKRFSFRGAK